MKLKQLTTAIAAASMVIATSAYAENTATIGGRALVDYSDASAETDNLADLGLASPLDTDFDVDGEDLDITDARINVSGNLGENYAYRAEIAYSNANNSDSDDEVDYTDLFLTFLKFGEMANITVGSQKEPFGLEALAAGTDTAFLNRSMTYGVAPASFGSFADNDDVQDTLAGLLSLDTSDSDEEAYFNALTGGLIGDMYDRSIGVQVHGSDGTIHYGVGLFDNGNETTDDGDSELLWAFTGRIAFSPVNEEGEVWHVGLSFTDREGEEVTIGTDEISLDADAFNIEAAWVAGPASVQLEYTDGELAEDVDFDGYYIQGTYSLTGESRPYDGGVFGRIAPEGDQVAYEVVIRYMENTIGDDIDTSGFGIGLNAYKSNNVRVGIEYQDLETEFEDFTLAADGFTLRTQLAF